MILVFLDLMVNQELQKLDSQGLQDLRENKVSQEQKDHLVVLGKWESLAFQESQVSQEPRENHRQAGLENLENRAFQEKEAILGKMEILDSLGSQASLELQEETGLPVLQETQDSLDDLEPKDPQGGAYQDRGARKDFQA